MDDASHRIERHPGTVGGFEERLQWLMGARLVLSVLSLGIALALEAAGWAYSPAEWRGFYGTVVFAFLSTILYGVWLPRVARPSTFAAVNLATDIAIVSALVHVSGGSDSPFVFLYLLVAGYGAVLFERRGAVLCAVAGAAVYGGVLIAQHHGWGATRPLETSEPISVWIGVWTVHAGAVVLVAALASWLSSELRRTGEALAERTTALSQLETLHRRTVESLRSGLLTTDVDGRVTSMNPEAERITGEAAAHALGRDVEEMLPGLREWVIDAGASAESERFRSRMPHRDAQGAVRHLGVGAYLLRDSEAVVGGHVVIFQDVTEVVEMETNLRRSERLAAVGELSASIAHEIRNPLAAISGSIEILAREQTGSGEGQSEQLMAIVLREVDRLDNLIGDFLRYARPAPQKLKAIRLDALIDEVIQMFDAAGHGEVTVEVDLFAGSSVLADADQLRQVLWNLVLNAAQAMPDGGRIQITARPVEPTSQDASSGDRRTQEGQRATGWVAIEVRDEGAGIPAELLERIFDPFFTTRDAGTGLGLATVHRIVEDHRGTIRLESSVGRGTRVRIELPGVGERE